MPDDVTHRCIDCRQNVVHASEEMCSSCGRCEEHCLEDNHEHMKARRDA